MEIGRLADSQDMASDISSWRGADHDRVMGRPCRWTAEQLAAAVAEKSIAGVLRRLRLRAAGANYARISHIIKQAGLSTAHFTGQGHLRGRHNPHVPKTPLERILVEGSLFGSSKLRKRLLAERVLEARCSFCQLVEWFGRPIPLELDHVDGDGHNNRLENLRLLCPNCHATTPTYRGKNVRIRRLASD